MALLELCCAASHVQLPVVSSVIGVPFLGSGVSSNRIYGRSGFSDDPFGVLSELAVLGIGDIVGGVSSGPEELRLPLFSIFLMSCENFVVFTGLNIMLLTILSLSPHPAIILGFHAIRIGFQNLLEVGKGLLQLPFLVLT